MPLFKQLPLIWAKARKLSFHIQPSAKADGNVHTIQAFTALPPNFKTHLSSPYSLSLSLVSLLSKTRFKILSIFQYFIIFSIEHPSGFYFPVVITPYISCRAIHIKLLRSKILSYYILPIYESLNLFQDKTTHLSPLTAHHSPLTSHCSLLIARLSVL